LLLAQLTTELVEVVTGCPKELLPHLADLRDDRVLPSSMFLS
jgi:hypothetical protein